MIDRMPREGYGYGIIRMSRQLTEHIAPLAQIELTNVQGELKDRGVFDQVKQALYLPADYTIMGIYIETYRLTWCILVEAMGVPIPEEGAVLPVLTPIYAYTFDVENGTKSARLMRIEVSTDPYHVLRVD
jgi:hypothetical protein